MRLDAAITDCLASLDAEGRSPRTVDAYRRDLRLLAGVLGADRDVTTVTPRDLLGFASDARVRLCVSGGRPRNQASINRTRTAVRGLFDFLVRAWILPADPAKILRVKTAAPKRATLLAPPDETKLLAALAADPSPAARRDLLMVRVMLATGIRLSSVVRLDVEDVDIANERLYVIYKGDRRMPVKLDPALGEELLAHAAGRTGALFIGRGGKRLGMRQVQLRFAAVRKAAGITAPVTIHSLRHTFGTRKYEETKDLRRVQVALGHRSVLSTERYVTV